MFRDGLFVMYDIIVWNFIMMYGFDSFIVLEYFIKNLEKYC